MSKEREIKEALVRRMRGSGPISKVIDYLRDKLSAEEKEKLETSQLPIDIEKATAVSKAFRGEREEDMDPRIRSFLKSRQR